MTDLYIGVMSGTSLDGVDTVIVELDQASCALHAMRTAAYPDKLAGALRALVRNAQISLLELGRLNVAVGEFVANSVLGGGAYNRPLVQRLQQLKAPKAVESSATHGIAPEWVEAVAFAWLGCARMLKLCGNSPSVTGARERAVLGGVYSFNQ